MHDPVVTTRWYLCFSLLWIATCQLVTAETSTAWPTFRGADRSAVAPDTGLLTSWPEDGPPLQWESSGAGRGYSSLAIDAGRVYTMGDAPSTADDEDEYLSCFDQADGQLVWQTKLGDAWNDGQPSWQSSRSTPTVDGDRVYALTAYGDLICCTTAGKIVWRKNLKDDFAGKKDDGWGYSESVLIDGDRLVCTPGGENHTLVALNKMNGELIWSSARDGDRGAGHTSIVPSEVGGVRVYVTSTGSGPMGVRADDGQLLWTYDIDETTAVIPTVIIRDDLVFFTAGYSRGGALLRQLPGDDQTVHIEEIYGLDVRLQNKHGGVVLVGDYVYGDSGDKATPFCADLLTGEIQWKERGAGKGSASFCAADGHLYIHYSDGTMSLVKATPDGFNEANHFKVPGSGDRPSWAHPVIVGGRLYLREGDKILCYDLRS